MTYYGFVTLFPLLLVLVTVLAYVLQDNPSLQHDIVDSAFADFPIVGDQIRHNVGSVQGSGIALVVGTPRRVLRRSRNRERRARRDEQGVGGAHRRTGPASCPRLGRSLALIATLGAAILGHDVLAASGSGRQLARAGTARAGRA